MNFAQGLFRYRLVSSRLVSSRLVSSRLLTSPLLHCLVLGALISWAGATPAPTPQLHISDEDIQVLKTSWQQQHGSAPDPAQTAYLIDQRIDDEILLQLALEQGYQQLPAVQLRLLQLADFLQLDGDSDEERSSQAIALGLLQSDPVVRRYMIRTLYETLLQQLPVTLPDPQQIHDYYQQHASDFTTSPRLQLSHVYIGGFDDLAQQKATGLLERLRGENLMPAAAIALGDPFYEGHQLAWQTPAQLERRFGAGFARQLEEQAARGWLGPIVSSYGQHLVWIEQRRSSEVRPLATVTEMIKAQLLQEAQQAALQALLSELRRDYQISLPDGYPNRVTQARQPAHSDSKSAGKSADKQESFQ